MSAILPHSSGASTHEPYGVKSMDICVVCRDINPDLQPFWPGLKQCRHCGHCVGDVDMQRLDLKTIYGANYFCGEEYADYLQDRSVFDKQFRDRLRFMSKFRASGDLIEIGCAYGFFLAVARRNYRVLGFDIAAAPVAYAREALGVEARCADILEVSLESASADVLVMWDTIEHLPRPDLTLDKAVEALRPSGFLFLTTGDIGSILARWRREKWRLVHPPTHLHYFNRLTISRLLESVGLRVVETRYIGMRRSLRQVAYSLFELGKPRPSWLYRLIAASLVGDLSFALNTYDIMLVVAQKTPAI
jgi:SAM-dependent methyltransferase